jgi:hypothetical protein
MCRRPLAQWSPVTLSTANRLACLWIEIAVRIAASINLMPGVTMRVRVTFVLETIVGVKVDTSAE